MTAQNFDGKAVLFVDDEPMATKYFDRAISQSQRVITAVSVAQAIEILQVQGDEIAVLITDQRMPGANGNELLRYARENHPKILRLLTTAYSELGEAIEAINTGEIYRYITKPWDLEILRVEVRLAVEVSTLRSERDELLRAKIQVQQAQLLANRVNNLALICGGDESARLALHQYMSIVKQCRGVLLPINWSSFHYMDWMQLEAQRHAEMAKHIQHWLAMWPAPSLANLVTALGGHPTAENLTQILAGTDAMPSISECAVLAWLLALNRAGQHNANVTVLDQTVALELTPHAKQTLPADWLAIAMEDLGELDI